MSQSTPGRSISSPSNHGLSDAKLQTNIRDAQSAISWLRSNASVAERSCAMHMHCSQWLFESLRQQPQDELVQGWAFFHAFQGVPIGHIFLRHFHEQCWKWIDLVGWPAGDLYPRFGQGAGKNAQDPCSFEYHFFRIRQDPKPIFNIRELKIEWFKYDCIFLFNTNILINVSSRQNHWINKLIRNCLEFFKEPL